MKAIGVRYGPHLVAFSIGYVVFSYASVPGVVVDEFDVGYTAVGLLMSAALASFVVVQTIGGRLVDDRPTLPILLAIVVINAALAVVLDLAPSFTSILGLRALWGLVGGLAVTVCATQLSRVYEGPTATWHQGLNGAMFTLGGATSFVLTPLLVAETGWFGVHAVGALAAVPAIVVLWGDRTRADRTAPIGTPTADDARQHGESRSTDGGRPGARFSTLTNRVVLLTALCNVATLGAYITLATFVTAYFDDLGIVGPVSAIALFVAALGRVGGGIAALRPDVGDGRVIAGAAGVGALGLITLTVVDGPALVALLLLALAAVSLPFGAIFKTTATATARDATAVAIVVAAGNVAALVLPAITGWLRDVTGGYDGAFVLLALLNLVAAAAGLAIARRR